MEEENVCISCGHNDICVKKEKSHLSNEYYFYCGICHPTGVEPKLFIDQYVKKRGENGIKLIYYDPDTDKYMNWKEKQPFPIIFKRSGIRCETRQEVINKVINQGVVLNNS